MHVLNKGHSGLVVSFWLILPCHHIGLLGVTDQTNCLFYILWTLLLCSQISWTVSCFLTRNSGTRVVSWLSFGQHLKYRKLCGKDESDIASSNIGRSCIVCQNDMMNLCLFYCHKIMCNLFKTITAHDNLTDLHWIIIILKDVQINSYHGNTWQCGIGEGRLKKSISRVDKPTGHLFLVKSISVCTQTLTQVPVTIWHRFLHHLALICSLEEQVLLFSV